MKSEYENKQKNIQKENSISMIFNTKFNIKTENIK